MESALIVTGDDTRPCPSCGQPSAVSATWCEACGHELGAEPNPACVACGESAVELDGYCHSCGHRQPGPRDHVEVTDGPIAAVSDRGRRHHHNEDAVAVARTGDGTAILVVCDGVSSTPGSAEISALAASTTAEALAVSAAADPPDGTALSDEALHAAVEAVRVEAGTASLAMEIDELNPPSSTLVAAVARPLGEAVVVSVVWLGDSRVYWIDARSARLLTADHEIDGALTRWIGIDASHHQPQTAHHRFPMTEDAELVVCSDGLWRYFAPELGEPAADLVARLKAGGRRGIDLVRAMVDHANELGGHDNVTVAQWSPGSTGRVPGTTVEAASGRPSTGDRPDDPADEDPPKEPMP